MKVNQEFVVNGNKYPFVDVSLSEKGVSLYDANTGVGGIDYMPADGATVAVSAGPVVSDPEVKYLVPSLNNNVYYLVSDTLYTSEDKATIISLATTITMTLTGDFYNGSFTFNNPTGLKYLYLIWDYTDSLPFAIGTGSYTGDAATKYINVELGDVIGNAGVDHTLTGTPSRFVLEWNNTIVADTGYIGLNSLANYNALIAAGVDEDDIKLQTPLDGLVDNGTGTVNFNKYLAKDDAVMTVYSPLNSNSWQLDTVFPTLTSFYIDTDEGTASNVCSQIANTNYYHDGAGTTPIPGDRIYTVYDGSAVFDGGNAYHLVSPILQVVPPVTGGIFVAVDRKGLCYAFGECDCAEVAAPTIDQDDIEIVQGQYLNIVISATNNPTSWELVTTCEEYSLTGGTKGSIFAITNCDGVAQNIVVNVNDSKTVCSTATPTLSFGDGTQTLLGACASSVLPQGLSFNPNTGVLSGTPLEACEYEIELIATNCFGDSSSETIVITITTGVTLTPFAIDVENFEPDGTAACAVTPTYSLLYHDGIGDIPDLNDKIYTDHKGVELFMGGSRWYNIDDSLYSIKICETGKVCDTHTC